MGVKEEWTGARAEQHLRKEVCGQAVDVQEDIWRMHDPVRDTAAALSAELGLRHCAARHALLLACQLVGIQGMWCCACMVSERKSRIRQGMHPLVELGVSEY